MKEQMVGPKRFLPYGFHQIERQDIDAVVRVLESAPLTGGPMVQEFEKCLSEATGSPNAVACASGTAALHLAVEALALPKGSLVAVPAMTFAATAACALYCQHQLVFIDCEPDTGLIDCQHLQRELEAARKGGNPIRAVLPVHFTGQPADMETIWQLKEDYQFAIIEDAAHALGAQYASGENVGQSSRSDMTVFSFHPVKHVAAGEGGALTTPQPALAERLMMLRNQGIERNPQNFTSHPGDRNEPNLWHYEIQRLGFNYRLTDISCALAASQMKRLPDFVTKRRSLAETYTKELGGSPYFATLAADRYGVSSYHLQMVAFKNQLLEENRSRLMTKLKERNVGTQVHYIPVPMHPLYAERGYKTPQKTVEFYNRILSVPLFPSMEEEDVVDVVRALSTSAEELIGEVSS